MRRFLTKPRTDPIVLALVALAASALLAACGGRASTPTATSVATATTAPATAPTSAPRAPASPAATAPTTVRQSASPTVTASASAKATTAPAASPPTTAKPGATRTAGGGAHSACDVITKADVEAVLGAPVVMPPAAAPDDPGETTSICTYIEQAKRTTGVMVSLGQPVAGDPMTKLPLSQAAKGTALQPLGGIGDEAVTDGRHLVITRKNGYQLAIIVGSEASNDPSSLAASKQLARIGADRL